MQLGEKEGKRGKKEGEDKGRRRGRKRQKRGGLEKRQWMWRGRRGLGEKESRCRVFGEQKILPTDKMAQRSQVLYSLTDVIHLWTHIQQQKTAKE